MHFSSSVFGNLRFRGRAAVPSQREESAVGRCLVSSRGRRPIRGGIQWGRIDSPRAAICSRSGLDYREREGETDSNGTECWRENKIRVRSGRACVGKEEPRQELATALPRSP
jgi:hypothetical protein